MPTLDIGGFLGAYDTTTPEMFRLRLQAEELTRRRPTSDFDSMESLESSRDTRLLPHQIHAAHFAVSNPLLKGVLLADEVGLGKTIEAAMIIKETIYRGSRNILVIASRSLCQQWAGELRERFALDFQVLDASTVSALKRRKVDPYAGFRIATYHFVNGHLGQFAKTAWDLVVVDEVHLLKNPQGALHISIKKLPRRFSCLLTATPIQNYLAELHALSTLVDPEALGTPFSFRELFCADGRGLRVQNVDELKQRLSRFAIRTLRSDVPEIKFTRRTSKLFNFSLYPDERELYQGVSAYLSRPNWAFGDKAAGKDMIVMAYRKLLASSSFALRSALRKVQERLEEMIATGNVKPLRVTQLGPEVREALAELREESLESDDAREEAQPKPTIEQELVEVRGYVQLCERITENAKAARLVAVMPELLQSGDKVLIFTQYLATQHHLTRSLRESGYEVVEFSGDLKPHANPEKDERELAKQRFRQHAQVMIATDAGAEGLNLQFCHIVVNFDLPWNPMKIEQRVGRCHRIGQEHDVVVANLVATENEVDARLVELLTDKIHLFDSVLGESDEILGAIEDGMDFEQTVFRILQTCRSADEIDAAFDALQRELQGVIEERRVHGRSLLQGFDDRIQDHLQVAEERAREALDRRTSMLRDFILSSLAIHGAKAQEIEPGVYQFSTPSRFLLGADELLDPEYHGTFHKNGSDASIYLTKRHPLIKTALDIHLKDGQRTALRLLYTGKHNIHGMDEFAGKRGWWVNFRVCFTGFEVEDHLLQLGMVEVPEGLVPVPLVSENLHRISVEGGSWQGGMPRPDAGAVGAWVTERIEALETEILERNAGYYVERRAVIDKFYGAKGDGEVLAELRHQIAEKEHQVEALQAAIDGAGAMKQKMELMRQQDKLQDELFKLQQRMQIEQSENFQTKRRALQELEQLRELKHTVEVISAAQWEIV